MYILKCTCVLVQWNLFWSMENKEESVHVRKTYFFPSQCGSRLRKDFAKVTDVPPYLCGSNICFWLSVSFVRLSAYTTVFRALSFSRINLFCYSLLINSTKTTVCENILYLCISSQINTHFLPHSLLLEWCNLADTE